jgi:hypothetical protein
VRAALQETLKRFEVAPMGPPTGTGKVAEALDPNAVLASLPPHLQKLVQTVMTVDKIPYAMAREIASQFSELGGGYGAAPVQSIREGAAKHIAGAMGEGIDAFLATQAPSVRAAKEAADQAYRVGKDRFNRVLFQAISGQNERVDPRDIVGRIFGNPESTLAFKSMADDALYTKAQTAWLADKITRATSPRMGPEGGDMFSPSAFIKVMEPEIKSGQLDVILKPETAQTVKDLVSVFGRLGRAENLAGVSTGTTGWYGHSQLRDIIRMITIGTGVAAGAGHPQGLLFTLGAPLAVSRATTTPAGISFLSKGLDQVWPRRAVEAAAQLVSQGGLELARGRRQPIAAPEAPSGPSMPAPGGAPVQGPRLARPSRDDVSRALREARGDADRARMILRGRGFLSTGDTAEDAAD